MVAAKISATFATNFPDMTVATMRGPAVIKQSASASDEDTDGQSSQAEPGHSREDEGETWKHALGERIDILVDKIGSVGLAAHAAGVSASTLRRYARGEVQAPFVAMVGLARQAGVSIDWLATGQGPRSLGDASALPSSSSVAVSRRELPPNDANDQRARVPAGTAAYLVGEAPPSPPAYRAPLPADLPRLAACLEAVQQIPEPLDAQRQLTLAYAMIGLIHYLDELGHQTGRLDREDLAAFARAIHKAVAVA